MLVPTAVAGAQSARKDLGPRLGRCDVLSWPGFSAGCALSDGPGAPPTAPSPAMSDPDRSSSNGAPSNGTSPASSAADPAVLPNATNLAFVEELYARYLEDPASVEAAWRRTFEAWRGSDAFAQRPQLGPARRQGSIFHSTGSAGRGAGAAPAAGGGPRLAASDMAALQDRVDQLVRAYRVRGHLIADLDPLDRPRPEQPELQREYYGLTTEDLDRTFSSRTIFGADSGTLRRILERLQETYCRSIGVQFMHIDDLKVKNWLMERMEGTTNRLTLSRSEQLRILTCLTDAVIFEDFLQKKFLGAKRFSLEGGETLIPLLDMAIEESARLGVQEIVLGMAHRGRINVLANTMMKPPAEIFSEFEDKNFEELRGRGDVKYHLGYSSDRETEAGHSVHLSLCFNPSHLEFVNPVALGRMRAKQDRYGDTERKRGMTILIHGDAAFIGQGVAQETLNLSQLEGYKTGGTLHVVVNNQIGFTTDPEQGRSCTYATDIAKLLQIPIFHVNGEDPEAVMQVVRLATQFRHEFGRDVVVDMYCYRRYGHNEGDEPAFTQPDMYRKIKAKKSVRHGYLQRLLSLGEITAEEADEIADKRRAVLEEYLSEAKQADYRKPSEAVLGFWRKYRGGRDADCPRIKSDVDRDELAEMLSRLCQLPDDFVPHPKIARLLAQREEMAAGQRPLDWAAAEALAMGTLLTGGTRIRMTGQDCERGTFSHRHAVLRHNETGARFVPLNQLAPDGGQLEIHNSPLSEVGVLGFEYGYSLDTPDALTLWEAQFGDFVNVAQVIIDQFLVSAEIKWDRLSGLVLLLPHGFEGQGPEHSSARLERFLSLSAEDNIQVCQPTTPANYFALLRRQVLRPWRKPLIVMTPKSLLRLPEATSTLEDLTLGNFVRVLGDDGQVGAQRVDPRKVRRVILCSGKVYYDLAKQRTELERTDVAILRVEQLYPLSEDDLKHALAPYPAESELLWVQEEPENMGAWPFLQTQAPYLQNLIRNRPFRGIARQAASVPATGSKGAHDLEQSELMERAFADS